MPQVLRKDPTKNSHRYLFTCMYYTSLCASSQYKYLFISLVSLFHKTERADFFFQIKILKGWQKMEKIAKENLILLARRAYYKKWRAKNPEKVQKHREAFILKKAKEIQEKRAEKSQDLRIGSRNEVQE